MSMTDTTVPKVNSKGEKKGKSLEGKREAKCHLREKCYIQFV
jgi:hypothetical protein